MSLRRTSGAPSWRWWWAAAPAGSCGTRPTWRPTAGASPGCGTAGPVQFLMTEACASTRAACQNNTRVTLGMPYRGSVSRCARVDDRSISGEGCAFGSNRKGCVANLQHCLLYLVVLFSSEESFCEGRSAQSQDGCQASWCRPSPMQQPCGGAPRPRRRADGRRRRGRRWGSSSATTSGR